MEKIRAVSLLVAGSLISLVVKPIESGLVSQWKLILVLFLLLVALGINVDKWIAEAYTQIIYRFNKKRRRIGVFSPYEINEKNSSWVNVSLKQLFNTLRSAKVKFSQVASTGWIFEYPVIVNPYGGVYSEKNASTLESLNSIFDYVRKGGVYLNIADIPFYYAYDEDLQRRVDTTPLINDLSILRSFLATQVSQRLHVFVFGINGPAHPEIFRVIQIGENSINHHGSVIPVPYQDTSYDCSPVVAIPYGRGHFLFSTLHVNQNNLNGVQRLISKAVDLVDK